MHFVTHIILCLLLVATALVAALPGPLDKRIYDGTAVTAGFLPYAASILIKNKDGLYVCGATIISPNYLITAAHCVITPEYGGGTGATVTVGYDSWDKSKQKQVVVDKYTVHPKYNVNNVIDNRYDIAILHVPTSMTGDNTKRILIDDGKITPDQSLLAMGWGGRESPSLNGDILRAAKLIVGDGDTCRKYYSRFDTNDGQYVCTLSSKTPGVGICGGDSGSAVVTNTHDDAKFVGLSSLIVALGTLTCGGANTASFFTHVYAYLDFITGYTGLTREYLVGKSNTKADSPSTSYTTTSTTSTKSVHSPTPPSSPNPSVIVVTRTATVVVTDYVDSLAW